MRAFFLHQPPRRQAEWDDHSEVYPLAADGPHLFFTLRVPDGDFYLSLYFTNKDGHDGPCRYRDFTISVRPHSGPNLANIDGFPKRAEWARGRFRDFWGGTYKRFLVRGPAQFTLKIGRQHNFCTILAGVFLDLVDEEPVPYFHSLESWKVLVESREEERAALRIQSPADRGARFRPSRSEAEAAGQCFDELERTRLTHAVWWACEGRRFYAAILRWTLEALKETPPGSDNQRLYARAATCYYHLGLYEEWEAEQVLCGKTPARQIEKALRWDGVHDFEGKGYQVVTDYLREHPGDGQSERVADAVPRQENTQEPGAGKEEP